MHVGVVGCGVAGMAAALALARRGHEVTLFEAFAEPRPMGSGLLLQPSGLAALKALGLADAVLELGARVDHLDGRDLAGRRIMQMAYDDWRPGAFGLGVHRASLFGVLHAALAPAGVKVETGVVIERLDEPLLPVLRAAGGRAYGMYGLAVIADGSASRLRAVVRPRAKAPIYPWGAVWANARDVDGRFKGALHQRYDRASTMMGVLPIGRGPGGETDMVSLFWSLPQSEMEAFFQGDLADWRARAERVWPEAAPLLEQFTHPSQFAPAVYRDVSVGRWSQDNMVLIGDAAHGTSPQLGQGANLALIDAVELAEQVDRPRPVSVSLVKFQARRRRQTAVYQLASRMLTPLFQSGGRLGPLVRDLLFTPLAKAPGLRWLSALVLTGVLRLGRTPPSLRR